MLTNEAVRNRYLDRKEVIENDLKQLYSKESVNVDLIEGLEHQLSWYNAKIDDLTVHIKRG
jgi:hypothetical protein